MIPIDCQRSVWIFLLTSCIVYPQAVSGFHVIDKINALSAGMPDNTAGPEAGAKIVDAGQLRKGTIVPNLQQM